MRVTYTPRPPMGKAGRIIGAKIPGDWYQFLSDRAKDLNVTFSEAIREAIGAGLERIRDSNQEKAA